MTVEFYPVAVSTQRKLPSSGIPSLPFAEGFETGSDTTAGEFVRNVRLGIGFYTRQCSFRLGNQIQGKQGDCLHLNRMNMKNVSIFLRSREYSDKNHKRRDFTILKSLICYSERVFKKVWERHSKQSIHYEGGRLLCENYRRCYYGYTVSGGPKQIYKLERPEAHSKCKIEDALIYKCFTENFPLCDHTPSLIGIQATSGGDWLVRINLNTGEILQRIFLSSLIKFRHISWNESNINFVVRSKSTVQTRFQRQAGISVPVSIVLAVFSAFPIKFVGMLEIEKKIFGSSITNAILSHDLLIVMYASGYVKFFSFPLILQKYKLYDIDIEKPGAFLNYEETCLPVNIKITEPQPVLFEVRCDDHNVQIGGYPWHYIITPHGTMGFFSVHSLKDHKLAAGGELDMIHVATEPDRAIFHGDNSGRIIHVGATQIRLLRIINLEDDVYAVQPEKCIDMQKSVKGEKTGVTSSGRCVKKRLSVDEIDGETDILIHQVDYEDELDLMWVSATYQSPRLRGVVCFHDNRTGDLLREVEIQEKWEELFEHDVYLDLDTIVQVVKPQHGQFVCTVYRLSGDPNQEPKDECSKSKSSRSSSSSGSNRCLRRSRRT